MWGGERGVVTTLVTVEKKDASFITQHYCPICGTKSALTQRRKEKDETGTGVGTVSLSSGKSLSCENLDSKI